MSPVAAAAAGAPPGYYQSGASALPCPEGTYSTAFSGELQNCTACRDGLTTARTGSTSAAQCSFLKAGYAAFNKLGALLHTAASPSDIIARAKKCPQGFYCPGGDPASSGAPVRCPSGMRSEFEGGYSPMHCVAPPGFKVAAGAAVECDDGYYKEGWNIHTTCTPCGRNPVTDASDPAAVVIGPGMGTIKVSSPDGSRPLGELRALACPANFYGTNSSKVYGSVAPPGFTIFNGFARECVDASFKSTFDNSACTPCGGGSLWKSARTTSVTLYNFYTSIASMIMTRDIRQGMGVEDVLGSPTAVTCSTNNYGINATALYGQAITPCTLCPTNMVTSCSTVTDPATKITCQDDLVAFKNLTTGGYFSPLVCKVLAGYGWSGGASADLCLAGTYSVGGHRSPCTSCPVTGLGFNQSVGAATADLCYVLMPGYAAIMSGPSAASAALHLSRTLSNTNDVPIKGPVQNLSLITGATLCPADWICPGGDPRSVGAPVKLAPPGFICSDINCSIATPCPFGTIKAGYDRSATCEIDPGAQLPDQAPPGYKQVLSPRLAAAGSEWTCTNLLDQKKLTDATGS
eukprot:gene6865-7081_t